MKKVWAYVISSALSDAELDKFTAAGLNFVNHWTAHENKLNANFEIFGRRIVLISVDEAYFGASGCSIDKLLRFIQQCEKDFNCQLLNRHNVAYEAENAIRVCPSHQIPHLLEKGEITPSTLVFNTAISNSEELTRWKEPLDSTWLNKFLVKTE